MGPGCLPACRDLAGPGAASAKTVSTAGASVTGTRFMSIPSFLLPAPDVALVPQSGKRWVPDNPILLWCTAVCRAEAGRRLGTGREARCPVGGRPEILAS